MCGHYNDKMIEICFPDNKMNTINACFATVSEQEMYRLLEILQGMDENADPFRLTYPYFTMDISCCSIGYVFHMYTEPIQYYLYTDDFKKSLADYLVTLDKLKKDRN